MLRPCRNPPLSGIAGPGKAFWLQTRPQDDPRPLPPGDRNGFRAGSANRGARKEPGSPGSGKLLPGQGSPFWAQLRKWLRPEWNPAQPGHGSITKAA